MTEKKPGFFQRLFGTQPVPEARPAPPESLPDTPVTPEAIPDVPEPEPAAPIAAEAEDLPPPKPCRKRR
jgi:fused signal recognition particle receptor